jgi:nucleotide-binding universal stress UspA family protein
MDICNLPAADAIIEFATHHDVDVIVIATHGRSGLSRWIFGSVTQKVIQAASIPVLVVRPTAAAA